MLTERVTVWKMEEKSEEADTASAADAAGTSQVEEKTAMSADAAAGQTTGTNETATSAAGEIAPSDTATSESGKNATEGSIAQPTHDQVVVEAQEKSQAAVEQDRLDAGDKEPTQSSEQPCPPATEQHTREETEAGSLNEQAQSAGCREQPSSDGPSTDATLSSDQPRPTSAESQAADEGSNRKTAEAAKPSDTPASEPSEETPASPAETQEHTQLENTGPAHQPTSDIPTATTEDKPVETSTEEAKEAQAAPEPQQGDQGAEASDTCTSSDLIPAKVMLLYLTIRVFVFD